MKTGAELTLKQHSRRKPFLFASFSFFFLAWYFRSLSRRWSRRRTTEKTSTNRLGTVGEGSDSSGDVYVCVRTPAQSNRSCGCQGGRRKLHKRTQDWYRKRRENRQIHACTRADGSTWLENWKHRPYILCISSLRDYTRGSVNVSVATGDRFTCVSLDGLEEFSSRVTRKSVVHRSKLNAVSPCFLFLEYTRLLLLGFFIRYARDMSTRLKINVAESRCTISAAVYDPWFKSSSW